MVRPKLKIGVNGRFFTNKNTGIGRYCINIFPEIARQFPELELVIAIPEKLDSELDKHLRYQNNLQFVLVKENRFLRRFQPGLSKYIWEKIQLCRFFRQEMVDIVHSPYPDLCAGTVNIPKVVTVHDIIPWSDDKYAKRTMLSHLYNMATLKASRLADYVITVSDFSKKETLGLGGFNKEKITTIHNASEFSETPFFPDEETRNILVRFGLNMSDQFLFYMGGYDVRKNVQRLVDIFEKLSELMPDLKLVLGGNKVLKNSLYQDLHIKEQIRDKIIYTGFLTNHDLIALYRQAAAFWSATVSEGFNLPLLEALTLGSVAIVSDLAVHREVAGELPFYFDLAENDSRIAREIATLLSKEDEYNKYKQKTRQAKEELQQRFSWSGSAQKIAEIYLNLKKWN